MALMKCPECGRENVSDSAEMCPGCGFGIKAYVEKTKQEEGRLKEEAQKQADIQKSAEAQKEAENPSAVLPEKEAKEPEANGGSKSGGRKKLIIACAAACLLVIAIIAAVSIHSKIEHEKEVAKYCDLPVLEAVEYDSERDCLLALLEAKESESQLKEIMIRDFEHDRLQLDEYADILRGNLLERLDTIINSYNGSLPYSADDIKQTVTEQGSTILNVGSSYAEGDYKWALRTYLTYVSSTYVEDCAYYFVNTLYPKTFTDGIIDGLLALGIDSWGDAGNDTFDQLLNFMDSLPGGREDYIPYIETAAFQLYEKNEEEGITVNGKKPPSIGMTAQEVLASSWGEPRKINKDTYAWGVKEQWCYSMNRYIYLEDGVVTSISE